MNCKIFSKFSCKNTSSSDKPKIINLNSDDSDVDDDPDVVVKEIALTSETEMKEWSTLFCLGNKYYRSRKFDKAIDFYSKCLQCCPPNSLPYILSNRSAAFSSLSSTIRQIPASHSERFALYGQDPTTLAELALKDAERLIKISEGNLKGFYRKGYALYLLERYNEAKEVYLEGMHSNPFSPLLLKGMQNLKANMDVDIPITMDEEIEKEENREEGKGEGEGSQDRGEEERGEKEKEREREMKGKGGKEEMKLRPLERNKRVKLERNDEFDCILCLRLLYNPVTTPCGHTFCRSCLSQAIDHNNKCPICRMVLFVNTRAHPISVTLQKIIEKHFPEEFAQRKEEMEQVILKNSEILPLFVMSVFIPCEKMALNIFEPRYRLMVRRIMEGDHRMGMVGVDEDTGEIADVGCEVEITECVSLPDGRFYIEIRGKRRFKILQTWEQDGYRVAKGEYIQDDIFEPNSESDANLKNVVEIAHSLAQSWLERRSNSSENSMISESHSELIANTGEIPPTSNPEMLCFWLANRFRISSKDRLSLLRTNDSHERFVLVLNHIQAFRTSRCRLQ